MMVLARGSNQEDDTFTHSRQPSIVTREHDFFCFGCLVQNGLFQRYVKSSIGRFPVTFHYVGQQLEELERKRLAGKTLWPC